MQSLTLPLKLRVKTEDLVLKKYERLFTCGGGNAGSLLYKPAKSNVCSKLFTDTSRLDRRVAFKNDLKF